MLTACTSMVPIYPSSDAITSNIRVGDKVRITSRGQTYSFKVTAMNRQRISGDGITIPIKQIDTIARKEISGAKTAVVAGGGAAGVVGIALAIAIATGSILIFL